MGLLYLCAMLFMLGELCDFVIGQDDFTVQFESEKTCFEEKTDIKLVLNYTGAGSPSILQWKFSKMINQAKTLNIDPIPCSAAAGADEAFPLNRMSYLCDNTLKIYTTTIADFTEANDTGLWEAKVLVNSVFTNFKNVTVEKCAATTLATTNVSSTSTSTTTPTTTSTTSTITSSTSTSISLSPTSPSISTSTTTTRSAPNSSSTSTTTSSTTVTPKPTTSPSSGNETTVIIVSSVVGGLFFVGIVITIVLMLLSQRRGHYPARNHRHRDQDGRHKRRDNHRYPSWQDHGKYNNASYMEYPGMGTKINPLYTVPYRSAHRAEQNYYHGHPSTDHQIYPRNHHINYGGYNSNVRSQTDMHSYQQRYYGRRGGNNISSTLYRDENNYVAPDYELYW